MDVWGGNCEEEESCSAETINLDVEATAKKRTSWVEETARKCIRMSWGLVKVNRVKWVGSGDQLFDP